MLRINHPPSASLVRVVRDFIYMCCMMCAADLFNLSKVTRQRVQQSYNSLIAASASE